MTCLALPVVSIRNFAPEQDSAWLHGLWHRSMHGRWAISLASLLNKLAKAALLLVAECEGRRSGFCAVSRQCSEAGLTLLLVEPSRQRCGIGTELICRVEKTLSFLNVRKLTLGRGGDYYWPGLPEEQRQAWPFFRKLGFSDEESSEDLIQGLDHFATPRWVSAGLASSGSVLRLAKPAQRAEIAAFEKMYFPAWVSYFENEMAHDGYENILLALGP